MTSLEAAEGPFWVPMVVWGVLSATSLIFFRCGYATNVCGVRNLFLTRTHIVFGFAKTKRKIPLGDVANVRARPSTTGKKNRWTLLIETHDGFGHTLKTDSASIAQAAARELRLAAGLPDTLPD